MRLKSKEENGDRHADIDGGDRKLQIKSERKKENHEGRVDRHNTEKIKKNIQLLACS